MSKKLNKVCVILMNMAPCNPPDYISIALSPTRTISNGSVSSSSVCQSSTIPLCLSPDSLPCYIESRNRHNRSKASRDSCQMRAALLLRVARDTEEYMTSAGDLCPPTFDLTTTSDSGDEGSRLQGMNTLRIPACESRWSMGSSIAEEPGVAEEEEREKEDKKMLNKGVGF